MCAKRKRRIIFFSALIITAIMLASALGAFEDSARAQSKAPVPAKPKGHLKIAVPSLGGSRWDPMLGSHNHTFILRYIFDSLVGTRDEDSVIDPKLGVAESWKMADDGKSWTFKLRKGIKFHNGDEVTAEDVKFSIDRYTSPDSVTAIVPIMRATIAGVRVVDRYTVRIDTKMKAPYLPWYLSMAAGSTDSNIVPKNYITKYGNENFLKKPVGSGPYKMVENVSSDYIVLQAVDKHWRIGVPAWEKITFREVPEAGSRVAQLKTGEVDIIPLSQEEAEEFKQSKDVRIIEQPGSVHLTLWPLWGLAEGNHPLRNPKVREALNLAINRKEMITHLFAGYGKPSSIYYGYLDVLAALGFNAKPYEYPFDPAKARQLLREAGHENLRITLQRYPKERVGSGEDMTLIVKGYWEAIGAKVDIAQTDWATFYARWSKADPQITGTVAYTGSNTRLWLLMGLSFDKMFSPTKGGISYFDVPEVAALARQANQEEDPKKAMELTRQMFVKAREAHAAIPIADLPDLWGVRRSVPEFSVGIVRHSWGEDLIKQKR